MTNEQSSQTRPQLTREDYYCCYKCGAAILKPTYHNKYKRMAYCNFYEKYCFQARLECIEWEQFIIGEIEAEQILINLAADITYDAETVWLGI